MPPELIEVAWAAGLFEGEGTATIKAKRQPHVALLMTDEDVVRRFAQVMDCGHVRQYHYPPRKPVWMWSAESADDVLKALAALYPFLGERRQKRVMEVIERAVKINEHRGFCNQGHNLADPVHRYLHRKTGKVRCRTCQRERNRRYLLRLQN